MNGNISYIGCEGYIFQQHGVPWHKSKNTATFQSNLSIKLLENWPPHPPDLSPIENMWSKLKKGFKTDNTHQRVMGSYKRNIHWYIKW